MKRPVLDAVRAEVRRRLQAGEQLSKVDVLKMAVAGSNSWANDTLRNLHSAGLVHIVRYQRDQPGLAAPVYAWGAGKDAKRPGKLSNAQKARRWRRANPEQAELPAKKALLKRRRSPPLDPVTAALLGCRKHGDGWIKIPRTQEARP